MVITAHVLAGGATQKLTHSPVAAFGLGFFSHFVLDVVPHTDPNMFIAPNASWSALIWTLVLVDLATAITITAFLWRKYYSYPLLHPFLFGALGGITPDLLTTAPIISDIFRLVPFSGLFNVFHQGTHFIRNYLPTVPLLIFGTLVQVALCFTLGRSLIPKKEVFRRRISERIIVKPEPELELTT